MINDQLSSHLNAANALVSASNLAKRQRTSDAGAYASSLANGNAAAGSNAMKVSTVSWIIGRPKVGT